MLTPRTAAKRMGFSTHWVQKLIHDEKLTAENHGTKDNPRYLIAEDEIERYMTTRKVGRPKKGQR